MRRVQKVKQPPKEVVTAWSSQLQEIANQHLSGFGCQVSSTRPSTPRYHFGWSKTQVNQTRGRATPSWHEVDTWKMRWHSSPGPQDYEPVISLPASPRVPAASSTRFPDDPSTESVRREALNIELDGVTLEVARNYTGIRAAAKLRQELRVKKPKPIATAKPPWTNACGQARRKSVSASWRLCQNIPVTLRAWKGIPPKPDGQPAQETVNETSSPPLHALIPGTAQHTQNQTLRDRRRSCSSASSGVSLSIPSEPRSRINTMDSIPSRVNTQESITTRDVVGQRSLGSVTSYEPSTWRQKKPSKTAQLQQRLCELARGPPRDEVLSPLLEPHKAAIKIKPKYPSYNFGPPLKRGRQNRIVSQRDPSSPGTTRMSIHTLRQRIQKRNSNFYLDAERNQAKLQAANVAKSKKDGDSDAA